MTARDGSITRKKITAFTFTVTLSRVTTSCGGTSRVSIRRDTRTMRSTGTKTKQTPGPLGFVSTRPRRKMTPRSYSARILMEEMRYTKTTMQKTINSVENSNGISASRFFRHRFHGEIQSIDSGYAHLVAGFERRGGDGIPVFATDQDAAFRGEIAQRDPTFPNHALFARDDLGRTRANHDC